MNQGAQQERAGLAAEASSQPRGTRLRELALLFLRLGATAFGGPAAHIAMMEDEVVRRRGWLDRQTFLDLIGATNLIPGPNSTELAIHVGHRRAGWPGLVVAGACFILPAMVIVWAIAALYVRYQALPQLGHLMYGVKPVIIAVVVQALVGLARTAVKDLPTAAAGAGALALVALGMNEIAVLALAGAGVMTTLNWRRARMAGGTLAVAPLGPLFWFFLKVGSVLYGSGYVLLAFLEADLVRDLGWLTPQQLLDAIAVGQFTPGPVFTTATFIGYVVAGSPGAVLATAGIFLPAFAFVAALNPCIPRLRRSPWAGGFLDGVNVASLALMAAVTWKLGREALVDPLTILLAVAAAVALVRFRVNSAWLVLGGGLIGLVVS